MKFGPVATAEAAGLISAHTVRAGDTVVKKGQAILPEVAERLLAEGVDRLIAARLERGDIGEDEAAAALAERLAGEGLRVDRPFTGRCNLFAETAGLLLVERPVIDAVNGIDEAITVATLPPFRSVVPGEMVATVKIIPYAVAGSLLERALAAAPAGPLRIAPYRRRRVGVVSTLLPGLKEATVAHTLRNLGRRLEPASAGIAAELRVPHEAAAVAEAVARLCEEERAEIVVVFGASAIADRRDVIPAGIALSGGTVEHLGMPVDPGNLLLVGARGAVPVIGAPGCARSPRENGFDWVLLRLLAGLAVTRADIVALGVGGLLMEIVSRPQPRAGGHSEADAESED
ncbi:molybdopterin-binding protein [Methylobacterium sp. sgz302541]|uniref:molybdopterin-binding protein n=1 Tax=unclassified Methylobacterium TaxID=2615210 RepID=UPI003D338F32